MSLYKWSLEIANYHWQWMSGQFVRMNSPTESWYLTKSVYRNNWEILLLMQEHSLSWNKPILLFNKPWTKGFLLFTADTEHTMRNELNLHKCQSLPAGTFAPSALLLVFIQSHMTQPQNTHSKTFPFQRLPWCDNPGHGLLVLEAIQPVSLTVEGKNNRVLWSEWCHFLSEGQERRAWRHVRLSVNRWKWLLCYSEEV